MHKSILVLLMLIFPITGLSSHNPNSGFYKISINKSSTITIKGTSNINSFNCSCNQDVTQSNVQIDFNNAGDTLHFKSCGIWIPVKSLDCKNSRMNDDMMESMQADKFPNIALDVFDAWLISKNLISQTNEDATFRANATLTITNVSRNLFFDVNVRKLGPRQFRLTSTKEILLTSFGITPPTALFGLIKVRDNITIAFDLTTSIE